MSTEKAFSKSNFNVVSGDVFDKFPKIVSKHKLI